LKEELTWKYLPEWNIRLQRREKLRKAMLPLMEWHTPIRKGIREEHLEMSLPSKRRTGQMFENPSFNLLKIREKPLLFLKKIPENPKKILWQPGGT
jgi:hypothetical protein